MAGKRKNGEGTWGKKTINGCSYIFYRNASGKYVLAWLESIRTGIPDARLKDRWKELYRILGARQKAIRRIPYGTDMGQFFCRWGQILR